MSPSPSLEAAAKVVLGIVNGCEHVDEDEEARCILGGFTDYVATTMEERDFEIRVREKLSTR